MAIQAGPERSAQRNLGIERSAGDWVMWIDGDMVLPPSILERAMEAARNADGVFIPEITVGTGYWTRCRALERSCCTEELLVQSPRLVKRPYMVDTGGFVTSLSGTEDAELRTRMLEDACTLTWIPDLIVHDEGRMTLGGVLRKRYYYGRGLASYKRDHPGALSVQAKAAIGAYGRHWRRLGRTASLADGRRVDAGVGGGRIRIGCIRGCPTAPGGNRGVIRGHSGADPLSDSCRGSAQSPPATSGRRPFVRSRARSDSVEVIPSIPTAPKATAERPLATGKKSSRAVFGTDWRPRFDMRKESEKRCTIGASQRKRQPGMRLLGGLVRREQGGGNGRHDGLSGRASPLGDSWPRSRRQGGRPSRPKSRRGATEAPMRRLWLCRRIHTRLGQTGGDRRPAQFDLFGDVGVAARRGTAEGAIRSAGLKQAVDQSGPGPRWSRRSRGDGCRERAAEERNHDRHEGPSVKGGMMAGQRQPSPVHSQNDAQRWLPCEIEGGIENGITDEARRQPPSARPAPRAAMSHGAAWPRPTERPGAGPRVAVSVLRSPSAPPAMRPE